MKTILAGAALLLASSCAALAGTSPEANPLATRPGWELGGQIAHYRYLEPDFAKLSGNRAGIVVTGTAVSTAGVFSRFDFRESYGRLKYEGSGTKDGVPDWILEARVVAGLDWVGHSVSLSPYLGLGYRYLYNDLRGYTSTGGGGYRRESNYIYAPVGLTARFHLGDRWILAPTFEAEIFTRGRNPTPI